MYYPAAYISTRLYFFIPTNLFLDCYWIKDRRSYLLCCAPSLRRLLYPRWMDECKVMEEIGDNGNLLTRLLARSHSWLLASEHP